MVVAQVFTPLGMADSAVGATPADGYTSLFGVWVARPELPGFRGAAAEWSRRPRTWADG